LVLCIVVVVVVEKPFAAVLCWWWVQCSFLSSVICWRLVEILVDEKKASNYRSHLAVRIEFVAAFFIGQLEEVDDNFP
jgi:hypothetical protein